LGKSTVDFNRWTSIRDNSWPYQVFKKHTQESNKMMWANEPATKLVYKQLKNNKATWKDKAFEHFNFPVKDGSEIFKDLKDWSESYNQFQNWTNLNGLMAVTSNFETYLTSVLSLALESDPGLIYKSSKSVDGMTLIKSGAHKFPFENEIIVAITKGDWNSRSSALNKYFDFVPASISSNIGRLEKIRALRNKVGHAFGRDIENSRINEVKETLPIEKLTTPDFIKIRKLIWQCVNELDRYLLDNHIGEFQIVKYFHSIEPELKGTQANKAMVFKKKIGTYGDLSGKKYCRGLVDYYYSL
jgi:hypothetical protein